MLLSPQLHLLPLSSLLLLQLFLRQPGHVTASGPQKVLFTLPHILSSDIHSVSFLSPSCVYLNVTFSETPSVAILFKIIILPCPKLLIFLLCAILPSSSFHQLTNDLFVNCIMTDLLHILPAQTLDGKQIPMKASILFRSSLYPRVYHNT